MEKIRIYNENGEDTGKVVTRGEYTLADGEFMLAAVMIVRIGEKVLITKRDKNKSFAGMWEFPGGAVHADEDSKAGGIRELKEETGITVATDKFNYLGQLNIDGSSLLMDVYDVEANPHLKLKDIKLQPGETAEAKILTVDQIDEMYDRLTLADQMIFDEFVVCMDEYYE